MREMLLEWKDYNKDLSNKLWEFFREGYLVDFNVTCHGQQQKIHKFILAFLFPMLKESLRSSGTFCFDQLELATDLNPGQSLKIPDAQCLNLDNIADHPEDVDYLIQFAYTGKTTVPNEHADCMMHIANSMQVNSLKESLSQWHEKMKPSNRNEPDDVVIPLSKLRPRTQLKKIYTENVDIISVVENDLPLESVLKKESNMRKSLNSNECLDNGETIRTTRRKKIQQNRISEKPHSKFKVKQTFKCPDCVYVAKFPYRLQSHMKTHVAKHKNDPKGPKTFICKTCNKDLGTKSLLDRHRATNCGTELFACKYCEYKTGLKYNLQIHVMSMHQVDAEGNPLEKNVKCPKCDFVCYAKHQLRTHSLAKHDLVGKYKCKECSFTAPSSTRLLKHERLTHLNKKDFMCEECGNRYQTSETLNYHVLVRHKGIKPHKCNICNAEYSDRLSFKIHMQRHQGKVEYKFVCHVCGHNLRRKYELRTHMRKKHGIELEEEAASKDSCQLQDAM